MTIDSPQRNTARVEATTRLNEDSDRGVGIVLAAFVSDELTRCVTRYLDHSTSEHRDRIKYLTHSSGPLGAFGTQIDLGWLLGIYSKASWRDLVRIKDIRNLFAHEYEVSSFTYPQVKALCDAIGIVDRQTIKDGSRRILNYPALDGVTMSHSYDERGNHEIRARGRFYQSCILFTALFANTAPTLSRQQPAF